MVGGEQPPLYLQPGDSRWLRLWVTGTHVLAAVITLSLPTVLPWWGKLLLLMVIAISGWYFWRLHVSRTHARAVQEVRFYSSDNCLLRTSADSRFVVLDDSSFLHPWFCCLNFRSKKGRVYTLLLTPDNIPPETLRRVRVRVKFDPRKQMV